MMISGRLSRFFLPWKKHFRKNTAGYALFGIGAFTMTSLLPNSVFVGKYRSFLAAHQENEEVPLSDGLRNRAQECLQSVDMSAKSEANYDFFLSNTMDIVHVGSSTIYKFTGGQSCFVGIPYFFEYEKESDIAKDRIKVGYNDINWDSEAGKQLVDSIILSDSAKDFAILRQIHAGHSNYLAVDITLKIFSGTAAYMTGSFLRLHYQWDRLFKGWAKGLLYGLIFAVYANMYVFLSDTNVCYFDKQADSKACQHGTHIMRGGVEYYDQLLARNKALRTLMKSEGPPLYTASGNYKETFRRRGLELTSRRRNVQNNLEQHLQQLQGETVDEPVEEKRDESEGKTE